MYTTMPEILLLLKLLLAHLLSSFVITSKKIDAHKKKKTWVVVLHGLVAATVATLLFATGNFNGGKLYLFILTLCTYSIIDWSRLHYLKKNNNPNREAKIFLYSQAAHILVILFFWITYLHQVEFFERWIIYNANSSYVVAYLTAYIFITLPCAALIHNLIKIAGLKEAAGSPNAGKLIGVFERIIILTFVFINQYDAIGFLAAAKSFRYIRSLEKEEDEYYWIGSLLSFSLAILTGEVAKLIA